MDSLMDDCSPYSRVSPFRNLRIKGYLLLPEAYRSLSRLSSALSAKHPPYALTCLTITRIAFSYIPAAQIASVLPGRGYFLVLLGLFLLDNQFYLIITSDVLLNIYKF